MSDSFLEKGILIVIYIIIIIMIPLFLDYLFKLTVRRKRKIQIKSLAMKKAKDTNKALLIFDNRYGGVVSHAGDFTDKESFDGDAVEIINQMADNSCVIVVKETLEYIDDLNDFIAQLKNVSGGDLYTVNIEKNSPRVFWDYKIKNIMNKSFYLPMDTEIQWSEPNRLQKSIQKFYSYVFKILPYNFFVNDSE